uniref:NADH-ubiquinone oxidoreductase chain 1 n=1 Tax=Opimothrips tubulatus TaxID=2724111 RepID=A0A9E9F217_9NEOP|nr:NADH dehydrogenase subunit 1 [Opimothrips tubulatus]WAO28725.1 NADH dehydrogenase subunit 1 [Opimothrips tubulatus]
MILALFLMNSILMLIFSLISVAFLTLFERKILSFSQIRLGPNKVGFNGNFQPFSDAIKLYTKEYNKPSFSNYYLFYMFPSLMLVFSFLTWMSMPFFKMIIYLNFTLMFFISILGFSVYSTMFMGWSSNSNYSNLGSIRSVAQTISYEISLLFIILTLFLFNKNFNFYWLSFSQFYSWNLLFLPVFFMWIISCLAELNRTPFDLSEAESELVSGFNTEFSGGKFAIIFMSEYLMIIIMSMLTCSFFLGCNFYNIFFFFNSSMIMFIIIWSRATLPRMRYDKLMELTWKNFLPSSLILMWLFFIIFFLNL